MTEDQDKLVLRPVSVQLNATRTRWHVDGRFLHVHSGSEYGFRCIAAIGPLDGSRVTFVTTANPRRAVWKIGRDEGVEMICYASAWSRIRTPELVLAEVDALLAKAGKARVDGWTSIPKQMIGPLIDRAATKAEVEILHHGDFATRLLGNETIRLRARLKRSGIEPEIADCYSVV